MNLTRANMVYLENEPYILSADNSCVLANAEQMAVTRIDGIIEIDPKVMETLYEQISCAYGQCCIETIDEFENAEFLQDMGWNGKPLVHLVNGKVVIHPVDIDLE
jgi:hypothetical protein